ncbi:hypothetical protein AVL50_05030 [Flammeovirga sp. SJP92]|nr:hypothetical protein AVL50_05030 [Flammeovirga sp. SJP92]
MKTSQVKELNTNHLTKKLSIRVSFLLIILFQVILVIKFLFPYNPKTTYGQIVLSSEKNIIGATLNSTDKWRLHIENDSISNFFKQAIIEKEDQWFYYHCGVDPFAIGRAFFDNITTGKRTSGASTISMQVIRLLEPNERTYWNKLIEIFKAIQLEITFSKEEILNLYLNLIPFGGNVEGIYSASLLYLQKKPILLSPAEATLLSIIPNRPTSLAINSSKTQLKKERNRWLKKYYEMGLFNENTLNTALTEPIYFQRKNINNLTPHLNQRLYNEHPLQLTFPTSINEKIQIRSQKIVKNYSRVIQSYGIQNAAAVIIDNKSHQIIAYIGSQDFEDDQYSGQVDGVKAVRSPGSTLKPLAYGMGFDKGLITPQQMILDVPSDFGTYSPMNYDQKFRGSLTVKEALTQSLNIPAVALVEKVGVHDFIQKLTLAEFSTIQSQQKRLGLSTVLGGCGVTLEELAKLYSAFANQGIYYSISPVYQTNQNETEIISKESAFMIREILSTLKRPDLPNNPQNSINVPKIAWKTGTSYGRKDAWSIGYNSKYTVGVWCGNFSNEGVQELTGAEIATPLLFRIFRSLYSSNNVQQEEVEVPDNLFKRNVCAVSGIIPNTFCDHQVEDWYIPLVSSSKKCTHKKIVFVHPDEKFSYCSECLPHNGGYIKKSYPNPPETLTQYYIDEKIPFPFAPPHNPACQSLISGNPPEIVSPIDGRTYYVSQSNAELELKAITSNDVDYVFWYINDKFKGKINKRETFFYKPSPGKNKISCSDDKGRNTDISIFVK